MRWLAWDGGFGQLRRLGWLTSERVIDDGADSGDRCGGAADCHGDQYRCTELKCQTHDGGCDTG